MRFQQIQKQSCSASLSNVAGTLACKFFCCSIKSSRFIVAIERTGCIPDALIQILHPKITVVPIFNFQLHRCLHRHSKLRVSRCSLLRIDTPALTLRSLEIRQPSIRLHWRRDGSDAHEKDVPLFARKPFPRQRPDVNRREKYALFHAGRTRGKLPFAPSGGQPKSTSGRVVFRTRPDRIPYAALPTKPCGSMTNFLAAPLSKSM
jgi:hypothetical protein